MHAATGWLARFLAAGRAVLDLLYPPQCAGCGRLGALFCAECQSKIEPLALPASTQRGRPAGVGHVPPQEGSFPDLDCAIATAVFAGPLREAIHAFKYSGRTELVTPLAACLVETWRRNALTADLIVPVPLHAARTAERGYNQSALLAVRLGRAVEVPIDTVLLTRPKLTRPQVNLTRQERFENVRDAFKCSRPVSGKRVVVVDDVCTTGATLEACAVALKDGGAASVWALTVARARWDAP